LSFDVTIKGQILNFFDLKMKKGVMGDGKPFPMYHCSKGKGPWHGQKQDSLE
jgi:hypothetical protein